MINRGHVPAATRLNAKLKPDAYVRLGIGEFEMTAFIEQDMDTESLPTITRKLDVYID